MSGKQTLRGGRSAALEGRKKAGERRAESKTGERINAKDVCWIGSGIDQWIDPIPAGTMTRPTDRMKFDTKSQNSDSLKKSMTFVMKCRR